MNIYDKCPNCTKVWNKTEIHFQACESCTFRASLLKPGEMPPPAPPALTPLQQIVRVMETVNYKDADGTPLITTQVFKTLKEIADSPDTKRPIVTINIKSLVDAINVDKVDAAGKDFDKLGKQLADVIKTALKSPETVA